MQKNKSYTDNESQDESLGKVIILAFIKFLEKLATLAGIVWAINAIKDLIFGTSDKLGENNQNVEIEYNGAKFSLKCNETNMLQDSKDNTLLLETVNNN